MLPAWVRGGGFERASVRATSAYFALLILAFLVIGVYTVTAASLDGRELSGQTALRLQGAMLLGFTVLSAVMSPNQFLLWARYVLALGIFFLAAMLVPCATCNLSDAPTSHVISFAPLIASFLYIPISFSIYGNSRKGLSLLSHLSLVTLTSVPAVFLVVEPKVCPICAGFLWCNVVLLRTLTGGDAMHVRRTISVPLLSQRTAVISVAAVALTKIATATGLITAMRSIHLDYGELEGEKITRYTKGADAEFDGIYLIGSESCPPCKNARSALTDARVPFVALPVCSESGNDPCLLAEYSVGLTSPSFLVVKDGRIVAGFAGWPTTSVGQSEFLRHLASLEGKISIGRKR